MARRAAEDCAGGCGKLLYRGTGSQARPTCRDCRRQGRGPARPSRPCDWCGAVFIPSKRGRRFCGDYGCVLSSQTDRRASRWDHTLTPRQNAAANKRVDEARIQTQCSWCSKECEQIERSRMRGRQAVCSRQCQSHLNLYQRGYVTSPWWPGLTSLWTSKTRRKARITRARGRPVNRQSILDRDEWLCHICRLPIPSDATVPDPLAATLDHVVPLARGGAHDPSNIAAAHFGCNVRKGDRLLATAGG